MTSFLSSKGSLWRVIADEQQLAELPKVSFSVSKKELDIKLAEN